MKEIVAFHIACPITSKRICSCALGFPRHLQDRSARGNFLDQIAKVDEFLKDPWLARVSEGSTVQVPVPKVVGSAGDDCDDAEELVSSAKRKRSVLQKKAAVVEGFARRFECGVLVDASKDPTAEDQAIPKVNVLCQLCLTDENEESEGSKWMLPCRSCGKKYHGSCLKTWSQYRDLFHWSSWTCPSCRVCKVCHTTGETTKFKFCKRCDVAVHCYCMQPPHKNVSSGPYLCPKHTKCHSCGSNVPGNGLSVRWFLGYTCCDACGRLFTKGNYCPVCLKVYRDSEPTPMICCDMCQQWVHCECDGISDEKYLQFQTDGNLPYTCPTCRGKCCQVRDLEDAVQELWRRRDEADKYLIASLRAAAGLPTQEEFFSISPFSDEEENDPNAVNREQGVVNFSFKSLADFSPKKTIESAIKPSSKKNAKKKGFEMPLDHKMRADHEQHYDGRSLEFRLCDEKKALHPPGLDSFSFPTADLSRGERMCSTIEQRVLKHKSMNEVTGNNTDRKPTIFQSKSEKTQDTGTSEDVRKAVDKSKNMKGTRLVVHLGGRNKTMTSSLRSDSLSRVQELMTLSGGEAMSRHRMSDYSADRSDGTANSVDANRISSFHDVKGPKQRERNIIKLGKGTSEASVTNPRSGRGDGLLSPERTKIISSNISKETRAVGAGVQSNVSNDVVSLKKHPDNRAGVTDRDNKEASPALEASPKVSKNLLRLKFKTPYPSSWAPNG